MSAVQVVPSSLAAAPQVVIVQMPKRNGRYDLYTKLAGYEAIRLGYLVIAISIGNICVGVAGTAVNTDRSYQFDNLYFSVASGIWAPAMSTIAGGLSVAAGKQKTRCMIRSMLAFCIIAMIAECTNVSMTCVGLAEEIDLDMRGSYMALISFSVIFSTTVIILCGFLCAIGGKPLCGAIEEGEAQVQYVAGANN